MNCLISLTKMSRAHVKTQSECHRISLGKWAKETFGMLRAAINGTSSPTCSMVFYKQKQFKKALRYGARPVQPFSHQGHVRKRALVQEILQGE